MRTLKEVKLTDRVLSEIVVALHDTYHAPEEVCGSIRELRNLARGIVLSAVILNDNEMRIPKVLIDRLRDLVME